MTEATDIKLYYDHLFPFSSLFKWLTYKSMSSDPNFFAKREFAFVIAHGEDDVYLRWNSFKTPLVWRKKVLGFESAPHKMDIGSVYSIPVSDKENFPHAFRVVERELVFDIDMDDYDDIRTCCQSKALCTKCWKFLAVAVKLLTAILEEDFGYKHLLWVFSGRRGIHCWVSDKAARILPSEARVAVVDYINLVTGSAMQKKKVNLFTMKASKVHPMVKRSYEIALPAFRDIISEQKLFEENAPHVEKCIDYLPPKLADSFRDVLKTKWTTKASPEFWQLLQQHVRHNDPNSACLMEIVLSYTYCRLDANVSKDMNHLLKSPFCVHRSTGKICVPIPRKEVDAFNPRESPTLGSVVKQLRSSDEGHGKQKGSFYSYLDFFENDFLRQLLDDKENSKPIATSG